MDRLKKILNKAALQALPAGIDKRVCDCIKKCDYDDQSCAFNCLVGIPVDQYPKYLEYCVMGTSNTKHCKCVKACTRSSTTSSQAVDCARGCLNRFGVYSGKVDFWIKECNKL